MSPQNSSGDETLDISAGRPQIPPSTMPGTFTIRLHNLHIMQTTLRSIFIYTLIPRNFTQKLFYRPRNFESFFVRRMTSKRDDYLSFNDVLGHNTKGNGYN